MFIQGWGVPFPLQRVNSWGAGGRRRGKGRGTPQHLERNTEDREGRNRCSLQRRNSSENHGEGYCLLWGKERFCCYFCYRKLKRLRLYIYTYIYTHIFSTAEETNTQNFLLLQYGIYNTFTFFTGSQNQSFYVQKFRSKEFCVAKPQRQNKIYIVSKGLFSMTGNLDLVYPALQKSPPAQWGAIWVSKTLQSPLTPEKCHQVHTDCTNPTVNAAKISDTKSPRY